MKNCNKKILAQYLYDLAKESKSEFIEISKDSELSKVAEKMNLIIPSPDIAILKTIYARTDVPNRNNIVLPKEVAKKALPTLIGKQANWSHKGANFLCGWILDAKLEKDLIVIYIAIYKSLFPEEFEKMKEMVKENKMPISFEIWNKNPETGESVLHDLGNGIKSIDPIIFHGVGILIEGETPACKEAYAQKLLATANKKTVDEAEKIANEVSNQDLVFATLITEEPICNNCGNHCEKEEFCSCTKPMFMIGDNKCLNCGKKTKEVKVITKQIESKEWICPYCEKEIGEKELFLDEKINKWYHRPCQEKGEIILPKDKEEKIMIMCEKCGKEFESSTEEKICVECSSLPKEEPKTQLEQSAEEAKKHKDGDPCDMGEGKMGELHIDKEGKESCMSKEAHEKMHKEMMAAEVKPIETQAQEIPAAAETKIEEPKVEIIPEVKAQEMQVIEPKIIVKVTRIYSEITVDTYVDGTSSGTSSVKGYSKRITEYKDGTKDEVEEEVEIKKKYTFAELEEKVNAAKSEKDAEIVTLKAEHERVLNEKDNEIKIKTEELGKKDQEIADLKNPKVESKKEKEMTVGTVEIKDNYKSKQKEIDDRAFGKR